jgi:hypothetical protein
MFTRSRITMCSICAVLAAVPMAHAQQGSLDKPIVAEGSSQTISGWVQASKFTVLSGAHLYATDDLFLECDGPIIIDGTIEAVSGDSRQGKPNATNITLISQSWIVVRGSILAGTGDNGLVMLQSGGDGTSIYLEAPFVYVESDELRGGAGGLGGPASDGGRGGDLVVSAMMFEATSPGLVGTGGAGGQGGDGINGHPIDLLRQGGSGGDGGDAVVKSLPYEVDWQELLKQRNCPPGTEGDPGTTGQPGDAGCHGSDDEGAAGAQGNPNNILCTNGGDGKRGIDMIGGVAGKGGDGGNGQRSSNGSGGYDVITPGHGGPGGRGGNGKGGVGGPGGNGGSCCSGGGPCGGKGGDGAKGTGGVGGNGGDGGNSAVDDYDNPVSPGGKGGDTGNGGDGIAGSGGVGGNAGSGSATSGGCITVAAGGSEGTKQFGTAGTNPGDGGTGNPTGGSGKLGKKGKETDGGEGGDGNLANPCS